MEKIFFNFDLNVKGFVEIEGVKFTVDFTIGDDMNKPKEELATKRAELKENAIEAVEKLKERLLGAKAVRYDINIEGFIEPFPGVKINIDEHFTR